LLVHIALWAPIIAVERVRVTGGAELTSSQIYDWAYARGRRINQRQRHSVWRILCEVAEPICKVPPHNAWLWRLRDPAVQKPSEN
jgi:hypothetical protein